MNFKHLKIGQKLTFSFLVLIILFGGVSVYQIMNLRKLAYLQDEGAVRAREAVTITETMSMP